MFSTSSSSSLLIPAEGQRETRHRAGRKRYAAWAMLGLALLLGSGAVESVAIHSSGVRSIFTSHITAPATGRSEGGATGGLALADTGGDWSTTAGDFGGGPPVP